MKIKPETKTVFVGREDLPCAIRAKPGWTSVFLGPRRVKDGVITGGVPEEVFQMLAEDVSAGGLENPRVEQAV